MFFRDIPGQSEIKENLRKTVRDSRISHAQIFYGPEGSGKLALALAFAQYISCNERNGEDACGSCPSCIKYSKLSHPDLHFVIPTANTEKKNENDSPVLEKWRETIIENPYIDQHQWYEIIGIENKQGLINSKESGEIIRKLNLKSYESDYKILIMWLPERMHAALANKLLKIIEEPPPETLFLMVSENTEDVLTTIKSRSQLVKIPKLKDEEIRDELKKRFDLDDQLIEDIVKLSDGNFNKAINSVQSDGINSYNFEMFVSFMRACYSAKIPDLMNWVDDIAKTGRERQKLFLQYGMRMFRENLLLNSNLKDMSHMAKYEDDWSVKFSRFITTKNITGLYEEFNTAYNHITANAYARIVFLDLGLKIFSGIKNG